MEEIQPLNPTPIRPRRRRVSAGKCILYTLFALVVSIIVLVLALAGYGLWAQWVRARDPHAVHRLQDHASKNISRSGLVQPIFQEDSLFDLAVSVWQTLPDVEQEENVKGLSIVQADLEKNGTRLKTRILFSDIVMRGLTLRDRGNSTVVQYKLPLDRFRDNNISATDLSSSMFLLPASPNPLDTLVQYTQWKPSNVTSYPKFSHPFPLEQESQVDDGSDGENLTLKEKLYNEWASGSYNTQMRFEHVNSSTSASDRPNTEEKGPVETVDEDDFFDEEDELDSTDLVGKSSSNNASLTKRVTHPYVVTKTHFYAIKETRPIERSTFNKKHKELRSKSCRSPFLGAFETPRLFRCEKTYEAHGEWAYKVQYNSTSDGGKPRLGYLPYLSTLSNGAGPLDMVRVPVQRLRNETDTLPLSDEPEFMMINWTIIFSGLTPGRVHLLENFAQSNYLPSNATHHQKFWYIAELKTLATSEGLFGLAASDAKPRTRFFIKSINNIIGLPAHILDIHYWYTRSSLVGINVPSVFLMVVPHIGGIFDGLYEICTDMRGLEGWGLGLGIFIAYALYSIIPTVLSVKLALPYQVNWKGWLPVGFSRSLRDHRERHFLREDSRVSWFLILSGVMVISGIHFWQETHPLYIIQASLPRLDLDNPDVLSKIRQRLFLALGIGSEVMALALQIRTNHRCRTFAGSYRLAAILRGVVVVNSSLLDIPAVAGKSRNHSGLDIIEAIKILLDLVITYQAWTLPRVDQGIEDDEE